MRIPILLPVLLGLICGCGAPPVQTQRQPEIVLVARWRVDAHSDDTKPLSPQAARLILIARSYYENDSSLKSQIPLSYSVYRKPGGGWAVIIDFVSHVSPLNLEMEEDGTVILAAAT